jgi:hypothetical protein
VRHNLAPLEILFGGGTQMNMSKVDRIVRAIVGIALLLLAIFLVTGVLQIIFWILAGILLVTALIGFCPAYKLFNFSTKK